jgi:thioredoxin 1
MSTEILIVTAANFQSEVLESNIPVLVDFYADWCGPCKMLAPQLINIAKEHAGKLKVVKVNADKDPDLLEQAGVKALPTCIIYTNGEKGTSIVGAQVDKIEAAAAAAAGA